MLLTGRNFTPAPAGPQPAVCVDFVDLGMMQSVWQGQTRTRPKCRVVFEIEARMPETGRRFLVNEMFTASLDDKAKLRKFLESWRGRPFTAEELKGFDSERLIHVPALIQIVHVQRGTDIFANINSIMLPPSGMVRLSPDVAPNNYVRVKDRPPEQQPQRQAAGPGPHSPHSEHFDDFSGFPEEEDDLPF